ncbi:MAG: histidine kinase, partial [Sphaerochaetaceae bacterium]
RSNLYIEVNNFAEEVRNSQEILKLFMNTKVTSRKEEFLLQEKESIKTLSNQLDNLKITYQQSPKRYFLYNALSNNIIAVNNILNKFNTSTYTTTDFYLQCYTIDKIFEYMFDYSSHQYLTALVVDNSKVVAKTEGQILNLRTYSILLLMGLLILYLGFTYFTTKRITVPIDKMVQTAQQIAKGNLKVKDIESKGPSELIFLETNLNKMKKSLSENMDLILENAKLEKQIHKKNLEQIKTSEALKTAKYQSLQSQINPHFFFNTLNTISRTALFEEAENTLKLINNLAGIFRFTFEQNDKITLKEELDFVEKYLEIQTTRFHDRISYSMKLDKNLNNMIIPPFIIQPLVENSMIHGLEPKEKGGTILIKTEIKKNRALIYIIDDGIGFHLSIKKTSNTNKQIGITNIRERIRHFYNNEATLTIKKKNKQGGVTAIINLPFITEKKCTNC